MINFKFNPWNEVIDIAQKLWPNLKADIVLNNRRWDWKDFPSETVWYPDDSDTALIKIGTQIDFMESVEILAKSLGYLAYNLDQGRGTVVLDDAKAETYVNLIYEEYMERICALEVRW